MFFQICITYFLPQNTKYMLKNIAAVFVHIIQVIWILSNNKNVKVIIMIWLEYCTVSLLNRQAHDEDS